MHIEPEISEISVVLVGNLNPRIFVPDWFARVGLFTAKEAEAAKIEVIHSEIALFRMEWLTVRVEQRRFIAETAVAPYPRLCDLVVRTFKECLPQTPIGRMGINRRVHFNVGSLEVRDRIGDQLAPREPWGDWGPLIGAGEGEEHGGLRSLVMEQREVDDRPKGHISATVQPSTKIGKGQTGIYMEINDHYEVEEADNVVGCEDIIRMLEENFDASIKRSEWIIDQIMELK